MSTNVISKELVSNGLQLANTALELLNTNLGTSVIQIGGVTTALGSAVKLFGMIKPVFAAIPGWGWAIAGAVTATVALVKAWDDAHPSIEGIKDSIEGLNQQLETNKARLSEISKMPWYSQTSEILAEKAAIEAENAELEKDLLLRKEQLAIAAKQNLQKIYNLEQVRYSGGIDGTNKAIYGAKSLKEVADALGYTMEGLNEAIASDEVVLNRYTETVQYSAGTIEKELVSAMQDWQKELKNSGELSEETRIEQATYLKTVSNLIESYNILKEAGYNLSDEQRAVIEEYRKYSNVLKETVDVVESTTKATMQQQKAAIQMSNALHITYQASIDLVSAFPELNSAISTNNGHITLNIDKLRSLADQDEITRSAMLDLVMSETIFNNSFLDVSQKVSALKTLAIQAKLTGNEIVRAVGMSGFGATDLGVLGEEALSVYTEAIALGYDAAEAAQMALTAEVQPNAPKPITTAPSGSTSGGGGGSTKDAKLEGLKSAISLLKSELNILEKQGASEQDRIAKIKEIQDALHNQAEYMRSIGASQEEINGLSASWLDYQKQIDELLENSVKNFYREQVELLGQQAEAYQVLSDVVQEYADEQIAALNHQLEVLQNQNEELDKQIEYEEKLDAIARAKQSRVMVYKDGRFQYVSDIDEISAAQSDMETFQRQQQRDKERQAIEAQIKTLENYKNQWATLTNSYENESNKQLALEKLHIDAEKANWDKILANAENYVNQYKSLMAEAAKANVLATGATSGQISGVDWSALWLEAQNDTSLTAEERAAKQAYYHAQKAIEMSGTGSTFDPLTGTWSRGGSLVSGNGTIGNYTGTEDTRFGGVVPSSVISNNGYGKIGNNSMDVTIQALNLPNVTNGDDFVEYVKNNMFGQVLSYTH